jgi:hemerythrin-like metal-binding protein
MKEAREMMGKFAWSEEMSVGVPALDADHRCIVRIIDLLHDVEGEDARRVIETVLDTLVVYCRYHFAREEGVMEWCGFPGVEFHRGEHEGFARFVALLRQRYAAQGDSAIAGELRDYLTRWLCHHILIQDMAYKPYVLAPDGADVLMDEAAPRRGDHVEPFPAAIAP